jgi:C4-dicarboxylate transporter DctM subunit
MIILVMVLIFLLLVTLGMPIAFSMILATAVAILHQDIPSLLVAQQSFIILNSYTLMAIPFFILAGEAMSVGGLTQRIIDLANSLVGHFRGALAQVTVVACTIFAGLTGSSAADTAAIGSVLIPAMLKEKYSKEFAIAVTCAAGCLGPIIPPSIFMIIYGALTGVSVVKLFLGGFIPGFCIALGMMSLCYYYSFRGEGGVYPRRRATYKELATATRRSAPAMVVPIIILGGIIFGIFTPTEAGLVAAVYAIMVGLLSREISLHKLGDVFFTSIYRTSQVLLLTAAAGAYSYIMARNDFGEIILKLFLSISESPTLILILICVALAIISTFLDALPACLILVPVFYPLGAKLGFDPTHFAICLIITIIYGGITPPVAPILYVAASIADGNPTKAIKKTIAFLFVSYGVVLSIIFVPQIVTFLPGLIFP